MVCFHKNINAKANIVCKKLLFKYFHEEQINKNINQKAEKTKEK